MNSNVDRILVTVLDDGTVKLECPGAISPANHGTAEAAIGAIARECGGSSVRERMGNARTHAQSRNHAHAKERF